MGPGEREQARALALGVRRLTETVVIACGVWSPKLAKMAGASIPLTPAVHQMISVGPIPLFEETPGEIFFPIVRDVDTNMYERQNGSDMEVGSYAHRSILMDPDEIPSIEESALSPTELPFTSEDFDLQLEQALELMPEILAVEGAGIRHAINGLLSLTPDGMPILGETPEVKNLWSVAAVWIKEGPGIARAVAEWAVEGASEIDVHGADIARFHPGQREQLHVNARASEGFNKTYGIVHPSEQWESNRDVRVSPFHPREQELGAVFFETAGWERPWWYESNAALLGKLPSGRQLQILTGALVFFLLVDAAVVWLDARQSTFGTVYIATVGKIRMLSQRLAKIETAISMNSLAASTGGSALVGSPSLDDAVNLNGWKYEPSFIAGLRPAMRLAASKARCASSVTDTACGWNVGRPAATSISTLRCLHS